MSAPPSGSEVGDVASSKEGTAVYVYGIVPADVELSAQIGGVGDPPAKVELVQQGEIAALVSEVPRDRALGTPDDLRAHAAILDAVAEHSPVLPLRFGAVVADAESVAGELLEAHHDEFLDALNTLQGHAEYMAKGRYVEEAVIKEIIDDVPRAAELREAIQDKSEDAAREQRIALGELLNDEVSRRRDRETARVAETLQSLGFQVNIRPATHELDAFQVACLAETDRQGELEEAMGQIADEWQGHVEVQLLGPLAPYDFVTTNNAES